MNLTMSSMRSLGENSRMENAKQMSTPNIRGDHGEWMDYDYRFVIFFAPFFCRARRATGSIAR